MTFDGRSMLAVAAALCLLLGLVVLAAGRRLERRLPGLALWAASDFALAAAAGLHALQGVLPEPVTEMGASALLLAGRAGTVAALLQLDDRPVPVRLLSALGLATLAGMWLTSRVWPDPAGRAAILMCGVAILALWGASAALGGRRTGISRVVTFAALAGIALVHLSRLAVRDGLGSATTLAEGPPVAAVHIGLVVTLQTLANVGFVLLVIDRLQESVARLVPHDPLTGALARGTFQALATRDLLRARRQRSPTAAFMLDVDHFKAINDQSGAATGDAVLRHVARRGQGALRCTDLFCRHGADKFVAILPETGLLAAASIAERLRRAVSDPRPGLPPDMPSITVTIGVAAVDAGERELDDLVAQADAALVQARLDGSNRTGLAEPAPLRAALQLVQGRR